MFSKKNKKIIRFVWAGIGILIIVSMILISSPLIYGGFGGSGA